MPSQRKSSKKLVSGYIDEGLKEAIDKLPKFNQTVFVELSVVRGLIKDRAITKAQLREMVAQDRLNPATVKALKADGIL